MVRYFCPGLFDLPDTAIFTGRASGSRRTTWSRNVVRSERPISSTSSVRLRDSRPAARTYTWSPAWSPSWHQAGTKLGAAPDLGELKDHADRVAIVVADDFLHAAVSVGERTDPLQVLVPPRFLPLHRPRLGRSGHSPRRLRGVGRTATHHHCQRRRSRRRWRMPGRNASPPATAAGREEGVGPQSVSVGVSRRETGRPRKRSSQASKRPSRRRNLPSRARKRPSRGMDLHLMEDLHEAPYAEERGAIGAIPVQSVHLGAIPLRRVRPANWEGGRSNPGVGRSNPGVAAANPGVGRRFSPHAR